MGRDCVVSVSAGDGYFIIRCSLHLCQLWISVIVPICCKKKSFDEGGTILICRCQDRYLGYSSDYTVRWVSVIGSSLGSMVSPVTGSWPGLLHHHFTLEYIFLCWSLLKFIDISWVGLFFPPPPPQLTQHLKMLRQLVLDKETSRSVSA